MSQNASPGQKNDGKDESELKEKEKKDPSPAEEKKEESKEETKPDSKVKDEKSGTNGKSDGWNVDMNNKSLPV